VKNARVERHKEESKTREIQKSNSGSQGRWFEIHANRTRKQKKKWENQRETASAARRQVTKGDRLKPGGLQLPYNAGKSKTLAE